jgi:FkbM family methyltransferase
MSAHEVFVLEYYVYKKGGFFIEVGANDGIKSNSHALERDHGWTGICIEPNPEIYRSLISNRQCKCYNLGVYSLESNMEFWKINGYSEMLSGFEASYCPIHRARILREVAERGQTIEKIQVRSRRLQSIIDENNVSRVDYLSIDTEGSEIEILKSIDYNKTDIEVISLEENYGNRHLSDEILLPNGYAFATKIELDNFYIRKRK